MNGDPIGESTFPGRDPNKSKDLVFRVGASAEVTDGAPRRRGLLGPHRARLPQGQPADEGPARVARPERGRPGRQQTELQVDRRARPRRRRRASSASRSAPMRASTSQSRCSASSRCAPSSSARRTSIAASFVADPVASSRDLRELGWYVGVTQEITRWAHDRRALRQLRSRRRRARAAAVRARAQGLEPLDVGVHGDARAGRRRASSPSTTIARTRSGATSPARRRRSPTTRSPFARWWGSDARAPRRRVALGSSRLALLARATTTRRRTRRSTRSCASRAAQFFRGAMPADESGPAVKSVTLSPIVHPGAAGRHVLGRARSRGDRRRARARRRRRLLDRARRACRT